MVVAVVLGIILLVKGGGVGFDQDAKDVEIGADDTSGSTAAETTTTTAAPPVTAVAPAQLQIVAMNAAGINGYAGQAQQFLGVAGYTSVTPITAANQSETTVVHYAEGFEVDAMMLAQLLGIEAGQVQPMPEDPSTLARDPNELPAEANIAILLGPDVQATVQSAATADGRQGAAEGDQRSGATGTTGSAGSDSAGTGSTDAGT